MENLVKVVELFTQMSLEGKVILLSLLVAILTLTIIFFYGLFINFKRHEYRNKSRSKSLNYGKNILYRNYATAANRLEQVCVNRWLKLKDEPTPEECFHKKDSFEAQTSTGRLTVREILVYNNYDRIKTAYDENGFFKLKGRDLDDYCAFKGGEIWDKAVDDFEHSKLDRFSLTRNYQGLLFSREEAIRDFTEFVKNAQANRKDENKKVLELIFILKPFLKFIGVWYNGS